MAFSNSMFGFQAYSVTIISHGSAIGISTGIAEERCDFGRVIGENGILTGQAVVIALAVQ